MLKFLILLVTLIYVTECYRRARINIDVKDLEREIRRKKMMKGWGEDLVKAMKKKDFTSSGAEQACMKFMMRFKYMETPDSFSRMDRKKFKAGLLRYQNFFKLPLTGRPDKDTMEMMMKPRCGESDPDPSKIRRVARRRQKRYVHEGTKWEGKTTLYWRLFRPTSRSVSDDTARAVMRTAFSKWSAVTNLDFVEAPNMEDPELHVRFSTYDHGDYNDFDGPGGVLAHAFYPFNNRGLSGDIHFDDSETFTVNSENPFNLLWVATHEIGHSIGLEHSDEYGAIMYPTYPSQTSASLELTQDDIAGIQGLYGSRVVKPTELLTPPPTEPPTVATYVPKDRPCPNGVDAIYYNKLRDLQVVLSKDDKIVYIYGEKDFHGKPYARKSYLPNLPSQVDGVLTTDNVDNNDLTRDVHIFFVGTNFYLYYDFTFLGGPFSIHDKMNDARFNINFQLPSYVTKVDAAIKWIGNERMYIFAGEHYWRVAKDRSGMDGGYPRSIRAEWKNVPANLDAATSIPELDVTYFVKENSMYKLDRRLELSEGYPQPIGYTWLNCGGQASVIPAGLRLSRYRSGTRKGKLPAYVDP